MLTSRISGAPICAGEASPLRVATGGSANWSSGVRSRRSPARANRRRDSVSRGLEDASLLQSSENHGKKLTHIGHLFMTNTRASLRSDNCPISIGMGVRFGLEQVSAFVGIRTLAGWGRRTPEDDADRSNYHPGCANRGNAFCSRNQMVQRPGTKSGSARLQLWQNRPP